MIIGDEPEKDLVQVRHAGFQRASGELIGNMDADMILMDGWLNSALEEFRRNPDLMALSGP